VTGWGHPYARTPSEGVGEQMVLFVVAGGPPMAADSDAARRRVDPYGLKAGSVCRQIVWWSVPGNPVRALASDPVRAPACRVPGRAGVAGWSRTLDVAYVELGILVLLRRGYIVRRRP
jgi:hypothetical protein